MEYAIHDQVRQQLEYLKSWVDSEIEMEENCKEWNVPYTPSRRKYENISNYEEYKREIEKNGDKNLLVMVKMNGKDGINVHGIIPCARRYVYRDYLVHRTEDGAEILLKEDQVNVIKK